MLALTFKGENSLRLLTSATFVLLQSLSNIVAESGTIKKGNRQSSERNMGISCSADPKASIVFNKWKGKFDCFPLIDGP